MNYNGDNLLDKLVQGVLKSPKYKYVCGDFIKRIGSEELSKRRNLKEAIKLTKNKLHQVGGAFLDGRLKYNSWLDKLRKEYESSGLKGLQNACSRIMKHHSSTRERLEIIDEFYAFTLSDLTPIRSVLDIACGLNPLSIPWMPLEEGVKYYACDIYKDMVGFLNSFFEIIRAEGKAEVRDVIGLPPTHKVDLALVLKTVPCLDQVDKSISIRVLERINADHLLVSFPVKSLSKRNKGMVENYEERFRKLIAGGKWSVKKFEFSTELAFLVTK